MQKIVRKEHIMGERREGYFGMSPTELATGITKADTEADVSIEERSQPYYAVLSELARGSISAADAFASIMETRKSEK